MREDEEKERMEGVRQWRPLGHRTRGATFACQDGKTYQLRTLREPGQGRSSVMVAAVGRLGVRNRT